MSPQGLVYFFYRCGKVHRGVEIKANQKRLPTATWREQPVSDLLRVSFTSSFRCHSVLPRAIGRAGGDVHSACNPRSRRDKVLIAWIIPGARGKNPLPVCSLCCSEVNRTRLCCPVHLFHMPLQWFTVLWDLLGQKLHGNCAAQSSKILPWAVRTLPGTRCLGLVLALQPGLRAGSLQAGCAAGVRLLTQWRTL